MVYSVNDQAVDKNALNKAIEDAKAAFTGRVTKCKAYMPEKKRCPVGGR